MNEFQTGKRLSDNRDFVMGIAILWIMFYHLPDHNSLPVLGFLQDTGYGGVDLFILLSGFGCWFSLNRDGDILRFFGKRLKRLLPAYLPFILIWMLIRFVTYQLYMTEIFGNLTMTGWWNGAGNQFNWYVDAIVFFYLLAPYICLLLKRSKKPLLCAFLLIIFSFAVSIAFMHGLLLIAMSRLSLFVLGAFLGRLTEELNSPSGQLPDSENGKSLRRFLSGPLFPAVLNLAALSGFALLYYFLRLQDRFDKWHYGLWWYPFFLIAPGLSADLAYLSEKALQSRFFSLFARLFAALGRSSFEIFLIHLFLFETAAAYRNSLPFDGPLFFAALFLLALAAGYFYHRLVSFAVSRFFPAVK